MKDIEPLKNSLKIIMQEMNRFSLKNFGKARSHLSTGFTSFNRNTSRQKTQNIEQIYATLSRNISQLEKQIDSHFQNSKGNVNAQHFQKEFFQKLNNCLKETERIQELKASTLITKSRIGENELESHLKFLLVRLDDMKCYFQTSYENISYLKDKLGSQKKNSIEKTVRSPNMSKRNAGIKEQRAREKQNSDNNSLSKTDKPGSSRTKEISSFQLQNNLLKQKSAKLDQENINLKKRIEQLQKQSALQTQLNIIINDQIERSNWYLSKQKAENEQLREQYQKLVAQNSSLKKTLKDDQNTFKQLFQHINKKINSYNS